MTTETIPDCADRSVEEATIGSLLLTPDKITDVLREVKLRPSSFYFEKNRKIYSTILNLFENHTPASIELIGSHDNLDQETRDHAKGLFQSTYESGNVVHFSRRLVELENWRQRQAATLNQLRAIQSRDFDAYAKARSLDEMAALHEDSFFDPARLAADFIEYIHAGPSECFTLPFARLNHCLGGGIRRQQMTIMGGWTSHGKSVAMDQMLEHLSDQGLRTHLYMNEMSHQERVTRLITRKTGIPYQDILTQALTFEDQKLVEDTVKAGLPFSISPCAGWSVEELAFDIRNREFDVVGVDVLHLFDYDSEIELARISRLLNRVAKQSKCHVIATVHLNEGRANDVTRPRPVTRDIRGSGMLKNDADNVMFVYREQDPNTGDPVNSSCLYLAKARNGMLGRADTMFNPDYLRFDEVKH